MDCCSVLCSQISRVACRALTRVINVILWRFRTGPPWADVPDRYGSCTTCYNRFVRWREADVWDHILSVISKAFDRMSS
uniref:Insertion element IS402-like domain-containing protein n=1 Tax=Agrobacterium fabrum TaxID=1176649 RepID=A0A2Z2PFD0_9HYPH|nr:hypothetical protein [Agrobacterium fabrum]ASK42459.1 hypothetical protein [Agrobacterium sp.]